MTDVDAGFRCAGASLVEREPMAGTAPTDTEWLFVEHAGPWGRQAVAESRLPEPVRAHLESLDGVRVQLIRRHGGESGPGVRVFAATLGQEPSVRTALLGDVSDLLQPVGWQPYGGPLWLVCTNGRRDVCCAELGRPVTAALAARWPDETWETTHLGGHRFAATLLALPGGIALGRLDPDSAVEACAAIAAGRLPAVVARGRAGLSGRAQVADLHLRRELGLDRLDDLAVLGTDGDTVRIAARGATYDVEVEQSPGEARRQSCADLRTKPAPVYAVVGWVHDRHISHPDLGGRMTPEELSDDDMTTAPGGDPVPGIDADGTDGGDGDGTDGGDADGTDGTDGDGTDGDGSDSDGTDGGDSDGTDSC